jgi:2-phosphosulfolactate phosphatase
MSALRVDVALLPSLREPGDGAVIVIDVLRATTSLAAVFAGGAAEVIVCGSLRAARGAAAALERAGARPLLFGETRSRRPKGFDFGNSPVELSRAVLRGRTLVCATTNGTRAFLSVRDAGAVFAGALVNREAAVRAALDEARDGRLTLLCAGREAGSRIALEDVVAAGAFVELALGEGVEPTDEALLALGLWRAYGGDALAAFRDTSHGRELEILGFGDDLRFAARLDVFGVAPLLTRRAGFLALAAS